MNYGRLNWLLPVLSGMLLALSSPPFSVPLLIFFSFFPILIFLNCRHRSFKQSFFGGFITGFIFFGQVFSWFFDVSISSLVGTESGALNYFLISFFWLICTVISASFLGFFSLGFRYLKNGSVGGILLLPSLWVIIEYIRAWVSGIFLLGSEALFGPHWTVGNLAYSLAQNQDFRLLAGVGGIYLISFLIVLINILLFYLSSHLIFPGKKIKVWYLVGFLTLLFLIAASHFVTWPAEKTRKDGTLEVAIAQTKILSSLSPEESTETKNQIQKQLLEIIAHYFGGTDLIVFPEGSNFLKQEGNKNYLTSLFPEGNVLLIDSGKNEEKKFVGSLYDVKDGTSVKYEKRLLIPYGDYLPYAFEFIGGVVNKEWLKEIESLKETKKGDDLPVLTISGTSKIGLLFCSEAVSPSLYRGLAEKGSQAFFNSGSLAFSGGSKILDFQTLSMLQLRAVESGRYLVRSTNYGKSYIINNNGRIIGVTPDIENQVVIGKIQLISEKNLYTKYGDWILILASLIILTFLVRCVIIKNRKIES